MSEIKIKAVVTGASGFIGSNLVNFLTGKGWLVRSLVHQKKLPEASPSECLKGDIRDYSSLENAFQGIDMVFHLAAALGASLINEKEFHDINALGTENVLKAAQAAGVKRVIHFSSAGVLGAVEKHEKADEDYPTFPLNAYDRTKLEGEKIALDFANDGMDVIVLRPGWVYGPGDRRTFKLIKAISKKRFMLITKGDAWQTPVYIEDLLKGTLLCAEKGKRGEIFNLAGKEVLTVKEIVNSIASAVGQKIPSLYLPLFPAKVAAWKIEKLFLLFKKEAPLTRGKLAFFIHPKPLSIQKATSLLDYVPAYDFKTGITKAVEWYRKHKWLE